MELSLLEVILLVLVAFAALFALGVCVGWSCAKRYVESGLSGLPLVAAMLGQRSAHASFAPSPAHENGE